MGPKVATASQFVEMAGSRAAIGSLTGIGAIVAGEASTNVVATGRLSGHADRA
jgi:carbamate kinase